MSFKVPKLNDSELGCIKSWWRIKIEPPRREQNESSVVSCLVLKQSPVETSTLTYIGIYGILAKQETSEGQVRKIRT